MGEHVIDLTVIGAVVFDSDGVVTVTARVHAAAWEHVFDAFLARPPGAVRHPRRLPAARGRPPAARRHPDLPGRARDHRPPEGSPDDEPCAPTVHGLGLAEDRSSLEQVDTDGVAALQAARRGLVDLRPHVAEHPALLSDSYDFCQRLGMQLQAGRQPGLITESARNRGASIVAVFQRQALTNVRDYCYLTCRLDLDTGRVEVEREPGNVLLTL